MLTIIYLQNLETVFRSGFVGHRVPCFTSWVRYRLVRRRFPFGCTGLFVNFPFKNGMIVKVS